MEAMATDPRSTRSSRRASLFAGLAVGVVAALAPAVPAPASNDQFTNELWGLSRIRAEAAWARTTGAGVKIGIVDSGVDRNHPDLAGRVAAATNCVNTGGQASRCSGDGADIDGHGTHVSGTAVAVSNNGAGVAGVAPAAQVVVARVFQKDSNGDTVADLDDVEAGIRWVVQQGAKVVNLSLGVDGIKLPLLGSGENPLGAAIEYAWANDAIPVVASGNSNQDLFGGSENYGTMNAVVVGASNRDDREASYSSSLGTAKWGVLAPGGDTGADANRILSTWPGNRYGYLYGTSMAAPHVAATLALLRASGYPGRDAAVQRLLATANRSVSCRGDHCYGRIDAAAAVGSPTSGGGTPAPTSPPATARPPAAKPRTTATTAAAIAAPVGETTTTAVLEPVLVTEPDVVIRDDADDSDESARGVLPSPGSGGDGGVPAPWLVMAAVVLGGVTLATALAVRGARAGAAP